MKVETKAKVKIENDAEHQNAILTVMNKLRKKHQHHGVFSSAPRLTYTHTHTHAVSRFDGKLSSVSAEFHPNNENVSQSYLRQAEIMTGAFL